MEFLTDFTVQEFEARLVELGVERWRARPILLWVHRRNAASFDEMTDLSLELRAELAKHFSVYRTKVQASHASPDGTTKHLVALEDGDVIELGNTLVTALGTPGHAPAHHAYAVADRRRGSEEPWLVFSGDSLLIGDVGRPDLHVTGDARGQAMLLHKSLRRLLELPGHIVLLPSHYGGSVCGRGLSGNPFSSIGFERAHNPMLALDDPGTFADALLAEMPPRPVHQEQIVAANRSGKAPVAA